MKSRSSVFAIIATVILLAGTLSSSAAVRTVLLDGFTNWGCGPCATWNPQERVVLEGMTRDTVIAISFHTLGPEINDPYYHWNVSENGARASYYNLQYVPWGFVDGVITLTTDQAAMRSQVRQRRNIAAPCTITMSALAAGSDSVHVTGTITATDSAITSTRLYIALITDVLHTSPSPNGETRFDNIFRDMWPSSAGQTITLAQGDSYTINATLHKDSTWNADSLSVVAFLQDYSTKWVHQSGWTHVVNPWAINHTCSDPRQMISPLTGEVTYSIHLQNTGNNDDSYTVSAGYAPSGWTQGIEATGVPLDPNSITVPLSSGAATWLTYHVNPNGQAATGNLAVTIQSQGNPDVSGTESFRLMTGLQVLLVDGDGGPGPTGPGDFQSYYQNSLQSVASNRVWGYWDLQISALDQPALNTIPMVIWFTGSRPNNSSLSAADQATIQNYLDNGGRLFLSGQGIAFDLRSSPFLPNVLHSSFAGLFQGAHDVEAIAGNPISDGLSFAVNGGDGANNQTRHVMITPADANATPLWSWQNYGGDTSAAVTVETGTYRVVYLSFGFEAIPSATSRDAVMSRVLDWMLGPAAADPRVTLSPTEFTLGQNYPNPFNPETVIPFVLPMRADVSLRIFDVLGREVAVLASGTHEAGTHTVTWNAVGLSSGLYFCRLDAKSGTTVYRAARKLMLLK